MKTYNEENESEFVGNRTFMIVQRENKKQFEKKIEKACRKEGKKLCRKKKHHKRKQGCQEGHQLQKKKYVLKGEK